LNRFVLLLALVGCGDKSTDTASGTDETGTSGEVDLANGETIHDNVCMGCHASNSFDLATLVPGFSAEELESIITQGSGSMAAQSSLSAQEVTDVIGYVQDTY